MNMFRRSLRTTFAFAAGAAMLVGIGSSAIASTDTVTVTAAAVANTCGLTSTYTAIPANAVWNSTAGKYDDLTYNGTLNLDFTATGSPGNRTCYTKVTNNDFTPDGLGAGTPLLPSTAFKINSHTLNPYKDSYAVPTGSMHGIVPSIPWSLSGTPNQNAVAGTYISTITFDVSNVVFP